MKKEPTDMGMNRTGVDTSPVDSKAMIEASMSTPTVASLDGEAYAAVRMQYAVDADPVGTVPPPGTLRGMATSALDMLKGQKPTVLIDKLGERLAFERTGTRLYTALIAKLQALGSWEGGPTLEAALEIQSDELRHAQLIARVIREIGADATAQTPCADVVGVTGLGLVQVLTDPRMDVGQSLQAILVAELTDNDGWVMLINLAAELGHDAMATEFRAALAQEERHLALVRSWVAEHARLTAQRDRSDTAA
jgi:ferritin-like protein